MSRPGKEVPINTPAHTCQMMVFALNTLNPNQVNTAFRVFAMLANNLWGWPPQVFREELLTCQEIMRKNGARTTIWFDGDQFKMDYAIDETRTDSHPEGDQRGDNPNPSSPMAGLN